MSNQPYTINPNANLPIQDFEEVYGIIRLHRRAATVAVNNESLMMLWEVGGYVSQKLSSAQWGDGVVRNLAEFITSKDPTSRGWSYRTIYRMVDLYNTYSSASFGAMISRINSKPETAIEMPKRPYENVTTSLSQIVPSAIVTTPLSQIPEVLFVTGWSNHLTIMARCKDDEERLFYMLYAYRENLKNKELERSIKNHTMESLLSKKKAVSTTMKEMYPEAEIQFKDRIYLDILGLPKQYKEPKLRKEIVQHMREFILEHPSYRSQLEFYLEVLDQEDRLSCENPSIGIILCKESDMDVVRYSLNRSISPMMVMQYEEQIRPGSVLQRSVVEYCRCINALPK